MNQLKDNNRTYYDGASGGWLNTIQTVAGKWTNLFPESRFNDGFQSGYRDAENLISRLKTDKNGNIIETIKIITHSMGGVFGAGLQAGLKKYLKEHPELKEQVRITLVAHFDPFNGGAIEADADVKTLQLRHKSKIFMKWGKYFGVNFDILGGLANQRIQGVSDDDFHDDQKKASHGIDSFFSDISSLQEGTYVRYGKTWKCVDCK